MEGMGCVADTIVILDDGTFTEDQWRACAGRLMGGIQRWWGGDGVTVGIT